MEDVTDLIFNACEQLPDLKFIAKEDFDLYDTMSSFEIMDKKMDVRKARNEALTVEKAEAKGILKSKLNEKDSEL